MNKIEKMCQFFSQIIIIMSLAVVLVYGFI